jgi:hypothetical protein
MVHEAGEAFEDIAAHGIGERVFLIFQKMGRVIGVGFRNQLEPALNNIGFLSFDQILNPHHCSAILIPASTNQGCICIYIPEITQIKLKSNL